MRRVRIPESRWRSCALALVGLLVAATAAANGDVVGVPAGDFAPLFGLDRGQTAFRVGAFWIDRRLVTRAAYAAFVADHPAWRRDQVPAIFADAQYLQNWSGDRPQPEHDDYPVTHVSWFAAQAYCKARGGRLPTTLEWEYVAAASQTDPDAQKDRAFAEQILGWYARPSRGDLGLGPVGRAAPNYFGLHDLHGLVWEWTSDFNASFITADNRADGDRSRSFFCGNGVTGAARREDYAAFMRYAMRGSLNADFALGNLGFRCAYDRAPTVGPAEESR